MKNQISAVFVVACAAVLLLASGSPPLQAQKTLYFPDYVNGGEWSVQLAVSNIDTTAAAAVVVTAYDQEGQPIPGFFDSEATFEIPALGSRVLRSTGMGEIRRGWIEVRTDTASVSGLLTYRNADTGLEVSVEPVELGNHFALFVEESSGIGTGLAIFKPDPASTIEFRIYGADGMNPLGEGFLTHPVGGGDFSTAWVVHPRMVRSWDRYGVPPGLSGNPAVAIRGQRFVRSDWDTIWEAGRIVLSDSCDPGHSGSGVPGPARPGGRSGVQRTLRWNAARGDGDDPPDHHHYGFRQRWPPHRDLPVGCQNGKLYL